MLWQMLAAIQRAIQYEWPLKLLALAVALGLWTYVVVHRNPTTTVRRPVDVQVVGVGRGLQVTQIEPRTVTVAIRGRYNVVNSQTVTENLALEADVNGFDAGTFRVPLRVRNPLRDIELAPGTMFTSVTLDRVVSAERPVIVSVVGAPADGFIAHKPQPQPDRVRVSGAASSISRVAKVVAEVDITGLSSRRVFYPSVQARDERDLPVPDLEIVPRTISVTVDVAEVPSKVVVIWPQIGPPPPGYALANVRISPQTVVVTGPAAVLGELNAITTAPVDISGVKGTATVSARLEVPQGAQVLGPTNVSIEVATVRREVRGPEPQPPAEPPDADNAESNDDEARQGPQHGNGAAQARPAPGSRRQSVPESPGGPAAMKPNGDHQS